MTISAAYTPEKYTGNGSTTEFPVNFPFYGSGTDSQITVIRRTIADGTESIMVNGTDYTVAGGSGSTGTVTATAAPTADYEWHILRATDLLQETDYVENDEFPADSHETALDRLTAIAQEDDDRYNRTPHFRKSDTYAGGEPHLPGRVDRPNKVLAFDANGDFTLSTEDLSDIEGAATSASAATAAAAAAATSETNAATSETNAANSATAAANSATAAAAAAASNLVSKVTDKATGDSPYTVVADTDDGTLFNCDTSGGNLTVNLPSIATAGEGERYAFLRQSASNVLTLARNGSDTINGVAGDYTVPTNSGEILLVVADDASPDNWVVVPWTQAIADESTLTKTASTLSIANGGVDTTQIADGAVDPTKAIAGANAQSGTTYTLALTDNLKNIPCTNASAVTVTIPTNASVAFTADETRVEVSSEGAGGVTVTADTGVTLNGVSAGSITLTQYQACSLVKRGTDAWMAYNFTAA